MFPINSAHAETCTLLAYYHARHTKNEKSKIAGFFKEQIMKRTKNRFKSQKAKIL